MHSGSVTEVTHLSPGVVVEKAELLPVSPSSSPSPSPFPSPNQVVHKSRLFSSLECSPGLNQPEHLIFYRLKCMQIGPSPREHPYRARRWEWGSESVAAGLGAGFGEGSSREVGGPHHEMTSPFSILPPSSCVGSRWLSTHPHCPRMAHCIEET